VEGFKAFKMKGEEERAIYDDPARWIVVSDVKRSVDG
jgi:hypothetical protein